MAPEGPYTSIWTEKCYWLIQTRPELFAVVPEGTQPSSASLFAPTKRDMVTWLKENGFERK